MYDEQFMKLLSRIIAEMGDTVVEHIHNLLKKEYPLNAIEPVYKGKEKEQSGERQTTA